MVSFRERLSLMGFKLHQTQYLERMEDAKEKERIIGMGPDYLEYIYPNELDKQKDKSSMNMLDFVSDLVIEEIPLFIEKFGKISDYDLAKKLLLINPNVWYAFDSELRSDKRLVLLCQPMGVIFVESGKNGDRIDQMHHSMMYNGGFDESNYPEVLREDPTLLQIYLNIRKTLFHIGRFQEHSINKYRSVEPGYDASFYNKIDIYKVMKDHLKDVYPEYDGVLPVSIETGSIVYRRYDKSDLGEVIDRIDLSNPKVNMFDFR